MPMGMVAVVIAGLASSLQHRIPRMALRVSRAQPRSSASDLPGSDYHVLVPHQRRKAAGPTTPSDPSSIVEAHATLGPVVAAARAAIAESTGEGTESSGSGRVEWGTWVDDALRERVLDVANRVSIGANGDHVWQLLLGSHGDLTSAVSLRVAGDDAGGRWDVCVHLLPAAATDAVAFGEEGDVGVRRTPPTGTLTVLKPLLGTTRVTKLRRARSGRLEPVGVSIDATGEGFSSFGATGSDNATIVLGGLTHHYAGKLGRSALLEVVLRPAPAAPTGGLEVMDMLPLDDPQVSALFAGAGSEEPAGAARESAQDTARRVASRAGTGLDGNGLSAQVGGLEAQLEAIARRVLVSRANPTAARQLGISHVRGILLSGPPGCGKTLLARELARQLGAREPQVVNGPECLSKFVGEAEANVRALFAPAEAEYAAAGDASGLHVIILDEFDAIARARGSVTGDTSGVRDSVVNQLLAKMDGVVEAPNVLVVGCTNRAELIDEALLRPGRLEVHLRVTLPDRPGRRDILRIHTRVMREAGALDVDALGLIEDADSPRGLPSRTEHFSGAELAGLVRAAASHALTRASEHAWADRPDQALQVEVTAADFERALTEVVPALGRRDDALLSRIGGRDLVPPSRAHARVQALIQLFTESALRQALPAGAVESGARTAGNVRSLIITPEGKGVGVTALAAWAGWLASSNEWAALVRLLTPVDVAAREGEEGRCAALADRFAEAAALRTSVLIIDDVDLVVGASPAVLATLRALLRQPLEADAVAGGRTAGAVRAEGAGTTPRVDEREAGGQATCRPALAVIATCSTADVSPQLRAAFEEELQVPLLRTLEEASAALCAAEDLQLDPGVRDRMAAAALEGGPVGIKVLLLRARRACALAVAAAASDGGTMPMEQVLLVLGLDRDRAESRSERNDDANGDILDVRLAAMRSLTRCAIDNRQ